MATPLPNSFTSYQLTEQEQLNGQILTPLNVYVIQNLISQLAEEKLKLKFDPSKPQEFIQIDAELQGQILILQNLLATSDEAIQRQQQQLNLAFSQS